MPVQLYGFNAHLFSNLSEAVLHPHGAVGVAIMLQVSNRDSNRGIKPLTAQLKKVRLFLAPILFFLTPNRPLIQLWCARSKLNMDEICSLNIHL